MRKKLNEMANSTAVLLLVIALISSMALIGAGVACITIYVWRRGF